MTGCRSGFGDTGSDVEAVFSRMDKMLGIFDEKQPQVHNGFEKKSFRQKIGDYFSWEKDCDSKMKTADDGTSTALLRSPRCDR